MQIRLLNVIAGAILCCYSFVAVGIDISNHAIDHFAISLKKIAASSSFVREQNDKRGAEKPHEDWFKDLEGESKEIEITSAQFKLPRDAQLKFNFPLIGTIILKPYFNSKNMVEGFQSMKPEAEHPWRWGALEIEQGLFKMSGGKLSYVGWGTFLGKHIRVGLKEFSLSSRENDKIKISKIETEIEQKKTIEFYKLVIGITFDEEDFSFEIMPGKTISFRTLDLILEEGKGISLEHVAELFGQPVLMSAKLDSQTKEFNFSAEITQRPLTTVLPEWKDSPFEGFNINGSIKYSFNSGLTIQGDLVTDTENVIDVGGVVLEEAHIDIDSKQGYALISGVTRVLGLPLRGYFALLLGEEKGIKFVADIPEPVKDWQPFSAMSIPALRDIVIHDIKAGVRAQYNAASEGKKTEEELLFPEKPQDIIKRAEEVTLEGKTGLSFEFFLSAKSTILNTVNQLILKVGKKASGGFVISFFALLPDGWKLSQSFPELFTPAADQKEETDPTWKMVCDGIDAFKIDRARIVASTTEEIIDEVKIDPGLNLMADVTIDVASDNEFIQWLAKQGIVHEGSAGASLGLRGNFNPTDPRNTTLIIDVSTGGFGLNLGPARFDAGALGLTLTGRPSIGFLGLFRMRPTPEDMPLLFDLRFFFTPLYCGVAASMKNIWKNPFGIPGFSFGDLGFEGTQTYTVIAEALPTLGIAALVPATFGLTGKATFGSGPCFSSTEPKGKAVCTNVALNLGKDITSLALVAEITSPLQLTQLADILLGEMGVQSAVLETVDKLIPIKVQKGSLYFVPTGTQIGAIKIQQGIGAALYLDLFGREAFIDASIGLQGLTARGKIPAFKCGGWIEMTNADDTCDKNTGGYKNPTPEQKDATCGPTIDIQANLENQHFIVDGLMKFGDIFQSRTKWYLTFDGIHFDTETFIGPPEAKFGIKIKGSSISFKPEDLPVLLQMEPRDLGLEIEFQDKLTNKIRKDISDELAKHKSNFEKSINMAVEQLGRQTLENDIRLQQEAVEKAARERVYFFSNPPLSISREVAYRAELLKLDGLKLKLALEETFIGQTLSSVARELGLDQIAKSMLMEIRTIGIGAAERVELFFKDISRLVVIERASWKGTAENIAKGIIPGIDLELRAGCKFFKRQTPAFDLKNIDISLRTIAVTTVDIIEEAIYQSFVNEECKAEAAI